MTAPLLHLPLLRLPLLRLPLLHLPLLRRVLAASLMAMASLSAQAAELTVSAAFSLTNAFRALTPAFEAQNPGTKVVFNFASSDALRAQIAQGAPADVFASADQLTMDRAEKDKLITPATRTDFARNTLVLIVPADSRLKITSLTDLQQAAVKRIALGTPATVPAGRYAREALELAKLWSTLQPRAVFAQNVRQALEYVARGEVEAAFVYATDAAILKDKVKVLLTVPTRTQVTYPMAAVAGSPNPAAARRFIDYVRSQAGQEVLSRFGFSKP